MKNKKMIIILSLMLSVCCLVGLAYSKKSADTPTNILLTISSSETIYKLGEIVSIKTRITNRNSEPVNLVGTPETIVGIEISYENQKNYQHYAGPSVLHNFMVDGSDPYITIKIGETLINQRSILWNYKPEVSHLNSDAAKSFLESRILTDYAFTKAGTYFIKAISIISKDGNSEKIESEPIKIIIIEPIGEDLEVWNKIKENGDIGYFLQEGDIARGSYYKPEEREKFLKEVDQILIDYPNSFYAEPLRQSLAKFQANDTKRQKYLKKMQKERSQ